MINMGGLEALGNAVVAHAASDYRLALSANNSRMIKECENFFCGDRFKLFTSLDGIELMHSLKNETPDERKSYIHAHKKVKHVIK